MPLKLAVKSFRFLPCGFAPNLSALSKEIEHRMTPVRYTRVAISLHWLIALLVAAGFTLGTIMTDMKVSPTKLQFFSWHKWLGVTIFMLAWLRVLWRVTHAPPPLTVTMPPWQAKAAHYTHFFLYLLLIVVPLSGWLYSSAAGYQTVYLGYFPIPDLLHKSKALAEVLKEVHDDITTVLAVVVGLHVAAALKHHFLDHDGLLRRMWFASAGADSGKEGAP